MERLLIKEQAVIDAGAYLNELAPLINDALASNEVAKQDGITGLAELKNWAQEMREAESKRHSFELLVGVAGSTGAGKTSLLNALIGIHEFLPSSCEQAATAVVCQVSWNHDMRAGFEYRAEVDFHSYAEIEQQVGMLFQALSCLEEIENRHDDDEDARIQDQAEARAVIDDVLSKAQAVWGTDLSLEDFRGMTAESLMESNKDVLRLLGTTKSLHDSDPEKLSRQVRPYLDSTIHNHGKEGKQFAAWPLVKQVRQFLRVDILKNGISLVDLPGLGDMVQSRAAVAQQFYEKLSVTIIVAPVIRAADEMTAHSLLGDQQELRLQMDGRYHSKGFGFVLTKADDINIRGQLARSKEIQKQPETMAIHTQSKALVAEIKALKNEAKLEEDALKKKKKRVTKAKSQVDRMVKRLHKVRPRQQEALKQELRVLKSAKSEAKRGLEESRKKIMHLTEQTARKTRSQAYMESKLAYLCTRTRNDFVQSRIQADFRVRQKRFYGSRKIQQQESPELLVEVIAVSSLAFWRLRNDESPIPGFPREAYTGIPRAKQWLWESTAGTREEHLDTVLNNYSKLLNWIRQWSQDEDEEANIVFTKQDIDEALQTVHNNNLDSLRFELSSFEDDIGRIDPLHNKDGILRACAAKVRRVIGRWHLMKPDDLTCTNAMHYMTHNAILRRDGASYTSPKSKINYAWVQSLGKPMLQLLVQDWDQAMNQDLPALLRPMMERVEVVWHNYIREILYSLKALNADLASPVERSLQAFDPIKDIIRDEIRMALDLVSKDAASTHPRLLLSLQNSIAPICHKALNHTGPGCFKSRKDFIKAEGARQGEKMFHRALVVMEKRLRLSKQRLPEKFDKISQKAITAVERHLHALFENILIGDSDEVCDRDRQLKVKTEARKLTVKWQADWNSGRELHVEDSTNSETPEEFDAEDAVSLGGDSAADDDGSDDEAMDTDDEGQDST
ncbi:Nuclear GTPase SLIP-GC like protein [Verticillium longisporum]|uniref:Nuclear GTPase SLIP-GC like protein n=1 Tax=Verticillium longisporum TaxID=100787 RepID=A0A8I3AYR0_VERLO|nr:Nuclear GTPase SLIP-GC like protein [Verticillium longisporum]